MECFILAGGKSKRFGQDKLSYSIGGRRVIDRVIDSASRVFRPVYIVVKEPKKFAWTGAELIEDIVKVQAPISGLLTALERAEGNRFCLLAGDYPLIKSEVLKRLVELADGDATLFRIRDQVHPLIGIYSRTIIKTVQESFSEGRLSLKGILDMVDARYIDENHIIDVDPELNSFLNMNTKEDLKRILEKAG